MEIGVTHIPPGGGRSLWVLGELVRYKTSEQTGGAYSLFEVTTQTGIGPPPHVQHREEESFYVLEGVYEFVVEGHSFRAGAGSLVYMPKGTLHAHKNVGEGLARMLMSQTPGGLCEHFFEGVGNPAANEALPLVCGDQSAVKRVVTIGVRYGIEIPSPIAERGEA